MSFPLLLRHSAAALSQRIPWPSTRHLTRADVVAADPYLVRFAISADPNLTIATASVMLALRPRRVDIVPERLRMTLKPARSNRQLHEPPLSTTYWRIESADVAVFMQVQTLLQAHELWEHYDEARLIIDLRTRDTDGGAPRSAQVSIYAQMNFQSRFQRILKHVPIPTVPTTNLSDMPFALLT
ncbi:hypothetical protein [Dyella koreensis]|uniref:DUF1833 domain-containing protein n=1 Tax=Dyella koreensis TaxID=311235 RepID=A0ABW8K800_9GAMM